MNKLGIVTLREKPAADFALPREYSLVSLADFEIDVDRTLNQALTGEQKIAHAVSMLASEAGEVSGIYQKTFQGQPLKIDRITDELGDVLFAVVYAAHAVGVSMDDIMSFNVAKRRARYPEAFDAARSNWRAD